jgi:hypothetical protein
MVHRYGHPSEAPEAIQCACFKAGVPFALAVHLALYQWAAAGAPYLGRDDDLIQGLADTVPLGEKLPTTDEVGRALGVTLDERHGLKVWHLGAKGEGKVARKRGNAERRNERKRAKRQKDAECRRECSKAKHRAYEKAGSRSSFYRLTKAEQDALVDAELGVITDG